jgi:hypothetical protein
MYAYENPGQHYSKGQDQLTHVLAACSCVTMSMRYHAYGITGNNKKSTNANLLALDNKQRLACNVSAGCQPE